MNNLFVLTIHYQERAALWHQLAREAMERGFRESARGNQENAAVYAYYAREALSFAIEGQSIKGTRK